MSESNPPSRQSGHEPRYRMVCVAPSVDGWSTDDLDEAIVSVGSSYYGSHFDIYDTVTGKYLTPTCPEEVEEAKARLEARRGLSGDVR